MKFKIYRPLSIFEIGCRSNMEDCIYPAHGDATDKDRLFILCDGMGGHENGEVASGTVCRVMSDYIKSHACEYVTDKTIKAALYAAIEELNTLDRGDLRKMGTTMTLLCFHRGGCLAAHIGDSRIYHIRPEERRIMYKSRDHSLVYDLYMAGEISREDMATYHRKNVITRAIMPNQDECPKADMVYITDIKAGDIFYMCSDGMLEQMDDDGLVDVLCSEMPWKEKREQLIEQTKCNKDNHSAYIINIAEVIREESDEALRDDEAASKCNAVYLEAQKDKNSDVRVVDITERGLRKKETGGNGKASHDAVRRILWTVLIVVMILFLVVTFMK